MITEIAQIEIIDGTEAEFENAVAQAMPLFLRAKGCHGARLLRSMEQPSRYRLLINWETRDDHMVTFRKSADFVRWRELAGPYFRRPPEVEHVYVIELDNVGES